MTFRQAQRPEKNKPIEPVFRRVGKIALYKIIGLDWVLETEELCVLLKLRRSYLKEKYHKIIDSLFLNEKTTVYA
jgi:hypothetical protein